MSINAPTMPVIVRNPSSSMDEADIMLEWSRKALETILAGSASCVAAIAAFTSGIVVPYTRSVHATSPVSTFDTALSSPVRSNKDAGTSAKRRAASAIAPRSADGESRDYHQRSCKFLKLTS